MSSSSKQTQQAEQQSTTSPWSVQQPYLTQAFSGAQTALNKAQTAVAPTNFTAQFTPDQVDAFTKMLQYGTGNTSIPGSTAAAGSTLAGAGANAASDALTKLNGFTPQGGTQSNIDAANSYVAGQNIPDQVKAAMLGANQEASDETLPSIARAEAGSGNINSSRNAIQQGIVQRGLAQQAGGLSAQLTGNAYNTGLGLAEQNSEAKNNNVLSALMAGANGGVNAANAGTNANTSAVGQQGGLFDIASGGVAGQNSAQQAGLTNEQQQFQAQTNDPFAALDNFYNIVGANNWGNQSTGSSTSTTTSQPSVFQTIGGLMTAGGSLLHSDRNVKRDIHLIGELFDGTPVYRFRYAYDPSQTVHVGLMAQDIEETMPEAVVNVGGTKFVNYDLATQPSIIDAQ